MFKFLVISKLNVLFVALIVIGSQTIKSEKAQAKVRPAFTIQQIIMV